MKGWFFLIFFALLLLQARPFAAFDFTWTATSPGYWRVSGTNYWLNLNFSFQVQQEQGWPEEWPGVGDIVFLTLDQDQDVTISQKEYCQTLYVGCEGNCSKDINGNPLYEQKLQILGSLYVGPKTYDPSCSLTRVEGNGLSTGLVDQANYVFIETKEITSETAYGTNTPGSPGVGGFFSYSLILSALNGTAYGTADFNYTILDLEDGSYVVTYLASQRVSGLNELGVYCSNTLIGTWSVDFATLTPPSPLSYLFNSAGTQIIINFTAATDRGGFEGQFDCLDIIDPTAITPLMDVATWLGSGAICYWETSSKLIVQLGNNAYPHIGDRIGIKGGISAALTVSFASDPQSGVIGSPPERDAPMVGISVPRYICSCVDTIVFDTLGSYGTTGRNWDGPGMKWKIVDSTAPNAAAIQAYLDEFGDTHVLSMPASLFTVGYDYQINLWVMNSLAMTANTTATFTRLAEEFMQLSIVGNDLITVNYRAELGLTALVSNPCNFSVLAANFQWSGADNATQDWLVSKAIQLTSKNLWIPQGSFSAQDTGPFHVNLTYTVTLADGTNLSLSADKYIEVDTFGLITARIQGPSQVDAGVAFILDPTYSVDTSGSLDLFTFTWDCVAQTAPLTGRDCVRKQSTIFGSATRLSFTANTFLPGKYLFSLVVSKDNFTRTDTTSLLVTVVETSGTALPLVTPTFTSEGEFSIHEPLRLSATVSGSVVNWTWLVDPPIANLSANNPDIVFTSDAYTIIVPANTFEYGIQYVFSLEAYSVSGYGKADLPLQARLPPISGRCGVTPVNTTATMNLNFFVYQVECEQFESGRGANVRLFDFGYTSPISGRDVLVTSNPGTVGRMTYSVPYGTQLLLVVVRWLNSAQYLYFPISVPQLEIVTDPTEQVNPIITEWAVPYSTFGSEEDVMHALLSALQWLNYQGTHLSNDNTTSEVLWDVPFVFTDQPLEIAFRSSRHNAATCLNTMIPPTVSRYSAVMMGELYAQLTTPTSATDQNLVYATQRYPFKFMAGLAKVQLDDSTVYAFLQGAWNQLIAQQYFFYSPGALVPLGQALTDMLNYLQASTYHGMIEQQPARTFAWRDITMLTRYTTFTVFQSDHAASINNVTVDLGSSIAAKYSSQLSGYLTSTAGTTVAWGMIVVYQNPFIYEQSSQGINTPIVFVNLINTEDSSRLSVTGLADPITYSLPTTVVYNPYHREVYTGLAPDCVYWDSADEYWSTANMNFTGTSNSSNLVCASTHLTEFAMRLQLAPIGSNFSNSTADYGWWIFAGVLGALLVIIVILAAVLGRRRLKDDGDEDEQAFINPNVVTVVRDEVE